MRSSRLLSIVLLLQNHGRLTSRVLAERLEVSVRTLHRDMEALSASGVPVFAWRGARGGWQLDPDWRMHVPALDPGEVSALLLLQPRALGKGQLGPAAERALEKLVAALPEAMRQRAAVLRDRLHVDPTGWWGDTEDLSALPTVQEAVALDKRLAITYRKGDGTRIERTVDPLGLVAKGGVWYLVADGATGRRTYRISRFEHAAGLEECFERPARFDLAAAWRASVDDVVRMRGRYEAVAHLEASAAERLGKWRPLSPATEADPRQGWVTRRMEFDSEDHALFVVLGCGSRVDVLAPAGLRERWKHELAAAGRQAHGKAARQVAAPGAQGESPSVGPREPARRGRR